MATNCIRDRFDWDNKYRQQKAKNPLQAKACKKKDVYIDTPVRYLGFTNEIGAAVAPMHPITEIIAYAPALGYIAMDVMDKYKRGDDDSYKEKSPRRATKQLIFQALASVILPTAAVKAGQIAAGTAIDKMPKTKDTIKKFVGKNKGLNKFISKFADKKHDGILGKILHGFQSTVDVITVVPAIAKKFIKNNNSKSGLRNVGLAMAGLATLAAAIKPIDYFVEHVIVKKAVQPVLYRKLKKDDE